MCLFVTPGPLGTDTRRSAFASSSEWDSRQRLLSETDEWGAPMQLRLQTVQRIQPASTAGIPAGLERPKTLVDGKRRMTPGEIEMSRLIFKDSLDYGQVWVHREEFLPFGLQPDDCAMTPNGEMYFNPDRFKEDFSKEKAGLKWWFMHEMVHVWQHQLGYWVMLRGAFRIGLSYEYELKTGRKLSDFNMEAQGNILADYFVLKHLDEPGESAQPNHIKDIALYEEVLSDFFKNPADRANLP